MSKRIGVSVEELMSIERVLFVVHLAIGDFTYMQNAFRAFSMKYPHLKIDIFVLESRCTADPKMWPFLKKEILYDWLEGCGIFNRVYRENYAPHLLQTAIEEANRVNYPLVISFGTLLSEPTELIARKIAGEQNRVAGLIVPIKWYRFKYRWNKRKWWKRLDARFYTKEISSNTHISDVYAYWFAQLGEVELSKRERYPYIDIPELWLERAKKRVDEWRNDLDRKILFINYLAKDPKRSWSLERLEAFIQLLKEDSKWREAIIIINTVPNQISKVKSFLLDRGLDGAYLFTAQESFYELPAILSQSDVVISVETSVMHLANAVNTPLIALMRLRTPEWQPLNRDITKVIWNINMEDNIEDIAEERVFKALELLY